MTTHRRSEPQHGGRPVATSDPELQTSAALSKSTIQTRMSATSGEHAERPHGASTKAVTQYS